MGTHLEEKVKELLNEVGRDFFAQNAAEYFSRQETEQRCWDLASRVMGQIWKESERYRPCTVYESEKNQLIEFKGDIAVEIGDKILRTKEKLEGGEKISHWVKKQVQAVKGSNQYAEEILGYLPPQAIRKVLITIPDEERFIEEMVERYKFEEGADPTFQSLDGRLSGVMYNVLMDSFERHLAEYIIRTFCKIKK